MRIMDDLAQHPMLREIPLETVVRYVVEFMRIVECSFTFSEKVADIDIEDHCGELPCDFHEEIMVRGENGEPYLYSRNPFFDRDCDKPKSQPTYVIRGGVIQTSLDRGTVQVSYRSIDTDDDGYPMIPDDAVTIRAIEAYVKRQWFTILFDLSRLPAQSLNNAQQEYAWAVGQCQSRQHMMSLDKAQSLTNSLRTLIQRSHEHSDQFDSLGARETIKKL